METIKKELCPIENSHFSKIGRLFVVNMCAIFLSSKKNNVVFFLALRYPVKVNWRIVHIWIGPAYVCYCVLLEKTLIKGYELASKARCVPSQYLLKETLKISCSLASTVAHLKPHQQSLQQWMLGTSLKEVKGITSMHVGECNISKRICLEK